MIRNANQIYSVTAERFFPIGSASPINTVATTTSIVPCDVAPPLANFIATAVCVSLPNPTLPLPANGGKTLLLSV